MKVHTDFGELGKHILLAWQEGTTGFRDRRGYAGKWHVAKVFEEISNPPKLQSPKAAIG
jgi:hypothetical protein